MHNICILDSYIELYTIKPYQLIVATATKAESHRQLQKKNQTYTGLNSLHII